MNRIGNYQEEPQKKRRPFLTFGLVLLVIFLIGTSSFLGFMASFVLSRFSAIEMLFMVSPSTVQISEMNILILGIDATDGAKRSDTIMVVHVDPQTKNIGIVSVPRDILVAIPGVGLDKINHAYAFGGADLACATTSSFLGIPVKDYIKIDLSGLEHIVDILGGVTVNIEKRMYYADYGGKLFIDLKPGIQKLTGKQAVGYLRFRHDALGDIGRVKRQQQFLQEVAQEIAKTKNPVKIYNLISSILQCVDTNISSQQIFTLSSIINQAYEVGNIAIVSLPGSPIMIDGISYLQPDMAGISRITGEYLKGNPSQENEKDTVR